jgi:hypothetical protein
MIVHRRYVPGGSIRPTLSTVAVADRTAGCALDDASPVTAPSPHPATTSSEQIAARMRRAYQAIACFRARFGRGAVYMWGMSHVFLSDEWFAEVDQLIAQAGDLQIPEPMKAVEVNVTITSADGTTELFIKDGLFTRGHKAGVPTSLTVSSELARKIFVEGDAAAGVQAFLSGEMKVEGDLAKLVAMQTVEPSPPQKRLTQQIAAITAK